jgi:thiol-disulfide isomerase/thioredoxin
MPNRSNILLAVATVFAILGVSAAVAAYHFFSPPPVDLLIPVANRKAAAAQYPTLTGGTFAIAQHPGQVQLINYFATWCPPCIAEVPDLVKIAKDYQSKGLVVAAISLDAPDLRRQKLLADFTQSHNLPFPVLLPNEDSPLFRTDMSIPQTLLVDREGRTAYHLTGQLDPVDLRDKIDRLLAEPRPGAAP